MTESIANERSHSISELRKRVNSGDVRQSEIREAVIRRLAEKRSLNAFITEMIDDNTDVDQSLPLAGIPIGIKDFFDTKDVRTTAGFVHFANRMPAEC